MGSEQFWDNLWGRVWNPITWAQIALIFLTIPLWVPIVRALWREVQEVLAPFGGVYGNRTPRPIRDRKPGEDPFAKIPIGRRRGGSLTPTPNARGTARAAERSARTAAHSSVLRPTPTRSGATRGTRPKFRSTM